MFCIPPPQQLMFVRCSRLRFLLLLFVGLFFLLNGAAALLIVAVVSIHSFFLYN
jgi:hypothetical protein